MRVNMKIDRKYKPQYIISHDTSREVLSFLNVEKEHTGIDGACVVATDGRRLVVIPCELEEGDVPGMIRGDAVKIAGDQSFAMETTYRKGSRRKKRTATVSLKLESERLITDSTASFPRYSKEGKNNLQKTYPNSGEVVPLKTSMKIKLALNPTFLLELVQAMGGKGDTVIIEAIDEINPLLISLPDEKSFGVLMPLRVR